MPVYFIQSQDGGSIKIGRVNTLSGIKPRLQSLQLSSPVGLRILGIISNGGPTEERTLHRRFSHLSQHGEWFNPGPELIAFVQKHTTPFEAEKCILIQPLDKRSEDEVIITNTANRIRQARDEANLSQKQVALKIGLTRTAYANIELGRNTVTVSNLQKLAAVFNRPLSYFFGDGSSELPSDEDELLQYYRSIPEQFRGTALEVVQTLARNLQTVDK